MRGNITRRGKSSWRLKFEAGECDPSGKRQTRFKTVRGTRKDAEAELTRILADLDKGSFVDPSKETLDEFMDRWERDWAASNVSPKTLERYKELATCHVRPHLGPKRLQRLRVVDLQSLYARLLRGDETAARPGALSPRTVGHVHRLLHRALGHAVAWKLLAINPASGVEPPKVDGTEIEVLAEDQARDVLQKVRSHSIGPIVMLALATGMRRGELLALRWRNVDLDAARLRVEQSLEQTKVGGLRFKSPKTKRGRRMIALPASAVSELRVHRKAQLEHRVSLGLGKAPDDALVFPNLDGTPRKPSSLTGEWRRLVTSLKLPKVSFHALRHTHASQLIASGMDVLTISRRIGHSSASITLNVYGHLFPNADDRAAKVTNAALTGVNE